MAQDIAQPRMSFEQALAELRGIMARETDNYQHPEAEAAFNGAMDQANKAWPPTVIPPQGPPPGMMRLGGPKPPSQGITFDGPPPPNALAPDGPQDAPQAPQQPNALSGAGYPLDERGQPVVSPRDVTPGQPQRSVSPFMQYVDGINDDINHASKKDLVLGALGFLGAGMDGPMPIAGNALNALTGPRGALVKRELRSYTEGGAGKNATEDYQIGRWKADEAAQPTRDTVDYANLPAHMVQERVRLPNGQVRFGKIPADVQAAREAGRQRLQLEQRSSQKYPTTFDENGEWTPPPGWSDVINRVD